MLSRSQIIIGLLLWIPVYLTSQSSVAEVECPMVPDTIVRTCLPLIPKEFKDFTSDSDEDKTYFESVIGGNIISSTNNVVIRVVDNTLAPFPQSCDDFRVVRRTFNIYDGDPRDPAVLPTTCILVYKVATPYNIRRIGDFPKDTVSCDEDILRIFNDYVINWGYIELDSCSSSAMNTRLDMMIPSVPSINYSCGDERNPGNGFVRIQFNLKNPCGDSLVIAADFYVEDNDAPEFTNCPEDITLEIDDSEINSKIADYLESGEADDNCNSASVFTDWSPGNFDPFSCDSMQVIPITFIAEDECGNQNADCLSNIIVLNDLELDFICPTNDLILECKDGMDSLLVGNWTAEAIATEFTGDVLPNDLIENDIDTTWFTEQICSDQYPVLFSVTDRCGTTASCTKNIIIEDTSNPVIINCPADTMINADTDSLLIKVENWLAAFDAADVCSDVATLTSDFDPSSLDFQCGDQNIPIRLLADDSCNPIDSLACSPELTIIDNVVADFDYFPNDTTIECSLPLDTSPIFDWVSTAVVSNNLGETFPIFADIDPTDPQWFMCGSIIEVPISFDDQCGDRITRSAFITIEDTTPPEITCPSDTTMIGEFQDLETEISAWLGTVQVTDNCRFQSPIWDYSSLRFDPCAEMDSQLVSILVRDDCGNTSPTCTTLLRIESQKQPTITCPPVLEIECGASNGVDTINTWLQIATAMDFNGNSLTGQVTNSYQAQDIEMISCFDTLSVIFKIINACGYEKKCVSQIKVEDTLNPSVSCPSTMVNTTSEDIIEEIRIWIEGIDYNDHGCLMPTMTHTLMDYESTDWCQESGNIDVQFRVEDPCGNTGTCNSRLVVNNNDPEISCPPLLRLECGGVDNFDDIINYLNTVEGTDNNGGDLVLEYDPDIDLDLSCVQEMSFAVSVSDNCGKVSSCDVMVSIEDTTEPSVDCPVTLSLLSGDPDKTPKYTSYLESIAFDDCTQAELTADFDTMQFNVDCVDITYMANVEVIDECGNINSDCSFEINISNNVSTTFQNCDASNNLTIECGDPDNDMILTDWFSTIIAEDNLENEFPVSPDITIDDPRLSICDSELIVTFELIDFCNASKTCNTSIFIDDNTDPVIQCPQDTSFMLGDPDFDAEVLEWLQSASSTDECDPDVSVEYNYTPITQVPPCEEFENVEVTFTATDDCGLSDICTAIVSIRTSTLPVITCPNLELELNCGDDNNQDLIDAWTAEATGVDANNNILNVIADYDNSILTSIECDGIIPVTFSTTDDCDITETCLQQISVSDTQEPTINCPSDITINTTAQDGQNVINDWLLTFTAEDKCMLLNSGIVDMSLIPTELCMQTGSIDLEFFAVDGCDTESNCISTMTFNDVGPTLVCGDDLSIQCGITDNIDIVDNWIAGFTATDNNNVDLLIEDNIGALNFDRVCEERIEVSFSIEDICGQINSCTRRIIQVDTLAPDIIRCPSDLELEVTLTDLNSQIMLWLSTYEAEDNCTSSFTENDYALELADFDCGQSQEVQFMAMDECDNINLDCVSTITFTNDLTVSITCPEPVSLVCNEPGLETTVLEFTNSYTPESIDDYVVESDLDLSLLELECTEAYTLMITLTIIDDCNNRDACETSIEFLPAASLYIPNTFSPMLTGENGSFMVYPNIAIESISNFSIYDRWGEEMFVLEDFVPENTPGWDGRNKNGELVPGVYTYFIQFTDVFGNEIQKVGSITLIR